MKSRYKFPNTYIIIFSVIIICAVATWFVPDSHPQTWQVFSALFKGFAKQAEIIVFILIIGGSFWIVNKTQAIDVGIISFLEKTKKLENHPFLKKIGVNNIVMILIMIMFSLFGGVFGMSEETLAFVVILVPLSIAMGYDSIVGVCMVYVAAHVGFAGAFLNPFTIGIAQGMADLPLFSGINYRIFCWIVLNITMLSFVLWYAAKVKKCPEHSPMYNFDSHWRNINDSSEVKMMTSHKIILGLLGLTICAIVVGVTCFEWYLPQLSALFLVLGIFTGI